MLKIGHSPRAIRKIKSFLQEAKSQKPQTRTIFFQGLQSLNYLIQGFRYHLSFIGFTVFRSKIDVKFH
jgi:hypothetical protein